MALESWSTLPSLPSSPSPSPPPSPYARLAAEFPIQPPSPYARLNAEFPIRPPSPYARLAAGFPIQPQSSPPPPKPLAQIPAKNVDGDLDDDIIKLEPRSPPSIFDRQEPDGDIFKYYPDYSSETENDGRLSRQELLIYHLQVEASDGFDVDYFPGIRMITPVKFSGIQLDNLAKEGLKWFHDNKRTRSNYTFSKVLKANAQGSHFYITFQATDASGSPKDFQTLVFHREPIGIKVRFCRFRRKVKPTVTRQDLVNAYHGPKDKTRKLIAVRKVFVNICCKRVTGRGGCLLRHSKAKLRKRFHDFARSI